MTVKTLSIQLTSRGDTDIQDITREVSASLAQSGVKDGILTIFCPTSTSALTTIEYESGCINDLKQLFDQILPRDRVYQHNARWGDGNGHSHIRSALLKTSLSIPFVNSQLTLGTWQQIVHVDFDIRPRQRKLIVQVMGE